MPVRIDDVVLKIIASLGWCWVLNRRGEENRIRVFLEHDLDPGSSKIFESFVQIQLILVGREGDAYGLKINLEV